MRSMAIRSFSHLLCCHPFDFSEVVSNDFCGIATGKTQPELNYFFATLIDDKFRTTIKLFHLGGRRARLP